MKDQVAQWILLQINQYRNAKGTERDILRNRIYKLLQPYLMSCIRNYLRDRKQYDNDREVVSISWDAFLKGLQSYKGKKELVKHFQTCCIRHVRNSYRLLPEVEFNESEVDQIYATCPDTVVDGLMLLQSFRDQLPNEYREVLDDTLKDKTRTFRRSPMDRRRTEEEVLSEARYHEAKRCFQIMIKFLIRRS